MKRFEVMIPLIAYIYIDVEVEDEDEVMEEAERILNGGAETYGFDPDTINNWEAKEIE